MKNNKKIWIDLNNPDVEHYATKFAITNLCGSDDVAYIRIQLRYFMGFKDPK